MAHCHSKVSMQWHPWECKQTWSESSKFHAANFFISEAFEAKHWMVLQPKEGTNLNLKMQFSVNCFVISRHFSPSIEFCYKTTIHAHCIENSYQVRKKLISTHPTQTCASDLWPALYMDQVQGGWVSPQMHSRGGKVKRWIENIQKSHTLVGTSDCVNSTCSTVALTTLKPCL